MRKEMRYMSKYFFVDRVKAIWNVAKLKDVSVDFAYDRFYADIVNGTAVLYNTGMTEYDFAADKALWDALSEDEQKAAKAVYKRFIGAKYDDICAAWRNNDMAAIDTIVEAFKAEEEAREAAAEAKTEEE